MSLWNKIKKAFIKPKMVFLVTFADKTEKTIKVSFKGDANISPVRRQYLIAELQHKHGKTVQSMIFVGVK